MQNENEYAQYFQKCSNCIQEIVREWAKMGTPIRILQVLGGLEAGGAETFVMNLYRAIDKEKIQFDFIKHTSRKGIFEDEITSMGGKIYCCPQYVGKNHLTYCKWWHEFFEKHKEYHVIHGHVRSTAAIYLNVAKKYGVITIAHSHSTSNGNGFPALVKKIMQFPIRYIADYLFACSDKAGIWLYGSKATQRCKYRMIPNGIDLGRFLFDEKKRKEMRNRLRIREDEVVLGSVGRFAEAKNHKFLVEIFTEYLKKNPNSRLLMVGDGRLFASIKLNCEKIGIDNKIIMPGSCTNTEDYYQIMDAFLFPSLWEGLGIAVIEAQVNGLDCWVSDNIPKEAVIAKNVQVLNLAAKEKWVNALMKVTVGKRIPMDPQLNKYDVNSIAIEFMEFYLEQHEKVKK